MIRAITVFVVLAVVGQAGFAFDVGDVVVVIHDTELEVDNQASDQLFPGLSLQIEAIKNNRLRLRYIHPGWIDGQHVVSLDQAVIALTEMIQQDPNNSMLYVGRSLVWQAKWDYDKAIADADEAIQLDPKNSKAYLSRGKAWGLKKNYDKAFADCEEAVRCDPKSVLALSNRSACQLFMGKYDAAIDGYNETLRLDPKYVLAYVHRGEVWRSKAEHDKAFDDFTHAIRLDPFCTQAHSCRGRSWQAKEEYDKAITDYKTAIGLDPKFRGAKNNLAWLWATCPNERYRNGAQAVKYAKSVCEAEGPEESRYFGTLAAAYAEVGDFEQAARWQEKAFVLATPATKPGLQTRLELYKRKQPYREELTKKPLSK